MKLGIQGANAGAFAQPNNAAALAATAEAFGLESLWTVSHVVIPRGHLSEYPYSRGGKMRRGEDLPLPDPLIWLAWVGAHSSQLLLATGVLVVPELNPLVLAKQLATLDLLCGGRVVLGVGTGWLREEYEVLDVPFERRGARLNDYIAAMRALWIEDEPTYSGEFVTFSKAMLEPKPVKRSIPVVVGGHSEAAAWRAGRLGDGFFPARADIENLTRLLHIMRSAANEAGRNPAEIEVTIAAPATLEDAKIAVQLGVSRFLLRPPRPEPPFMESDLEVQLERLSGAR